MTSNQNSACRLLIFTRYPQPGKAKTRLIPALGAAGAANLQRQMTEHLLKQVQPLQAADLFSVEVWFAGSENSLIGDSTADRQLMQDWLGTDWSYQVQSQGDLGERLIEATRTAFADGMQRVVTIGTDCPELDATGLQLAFAALEQHDLVLGPATDGGYYLIGMRQFLPDLFRGITWSSEVVLQQTVAIAERLELAVTYLEPLTDIDRPADLAVWQQVQQHYPDDAARSGQPLLSVIIPVLNEASSIQATLQSLQTPAVEVIVVDGGSHDQTVELATAMGAKVVETAPGRAKQMNAGAKLAAGEILLFLHGDTQLPPEFVTIVQQTLTQPQTVAGAFELTIAGQQLGLRCVEWGVKWRSRLLQLPYGDQAIFLTAKQFAQVGGFTELPIMEDFEFVRRLQTCGKIAIAPAAVVTSGRRWHTLGVWQTTLMNQLIILAYFLGVPIEQIARWYRRK